MGGPVKLFVFAVYDGFTLALEGEGSVLKEPSLLSGEDGDRDPESRSF